MTGINVSALDPRYSFMVSGVSYIGKPRPNTVMYVAKKVEKLLGSLADQKDCLVFAETGIEVPASVKKSNCVILTDHPQYEYARMAWKIAEEEDKREKSGKYTLVNHAYYVGENVKIGKGTVILPGCWIGHDVVIGDRTTILPGCRISHCVIGNDCFINENAVIGNRGFTMTEDDRGNKYRIPSLGRVVIKDHVEIGALDSIARGSGDDTILESYVKLDALVYIAHDVHLMHNVEMAGGSEAGGYAVIGENTFMGLNASLRNRRNVGANDFIGMGTVVVKSVEEENVTMVGNPAEQIRYGEENK